MLALADQLSARAAIDLLALAFETQRKDLGEPDQRLELSGPNGGPIPARFTITIDRAHAGETGEDA